MGFGAKCDGSGDDRAAIQRAIDIASPNRVQLPTGTCGRISIAFKGATKSGSFTVAVNSAGAAQESTTDATITGVGNLANKITVHFQAPWSIVLRNNSAKP
jgi:hypothetical protein